MTTTKQLDIVRFPGFGQLGRRRLAILGQHTDQVSLDPGTILLREGQATGTVHLLCDGSVIVSSQATPLRRVEAPAIFGQRGALAHRAEPSTIVTAERVRLLVMSREQARDGLGGDPDLWAILATRPLISAA